MTLKFNLFRFLAAGLCDYYFCFFHFLTSSYILFCLITSSDIFLLCPHVYIKLISVIICIYIYIYDMHDYTSTYMEPGHEAVAR